MTVVRMQRRCDGCGKMAACYLIDGAWGCSGCSTARMVTGSLADALETLEDIARDGPDAATNLARALRMGAANAFWGRMLQRMADDVEAGATRQGPANAGNAVKMQGGRRAAFSSVLDRAGTVNIVYDFPDLATAYRMGRRRGRARDRACGARREAHTRRCKERGYAPPEYRAFRAPPEQRWAANYLRHECSGYEETYKRLQKEVRKLLGPGIPKDDLDVACEQVHQTVKNRVQREIAAQFPELAGAAIEQTV